MRNELTALFGADALFVEPSAFQAWLTEAKVRAAGLQGGTGVQAAIQAYDQRERGPRLIGDVAVIDICGPITYKSGWLSWYFGASSIADLQLKFRTALADPAVKTILFRVDSPGGEVTMVPEFADEIFAARGQKPILAVADTLVASAAYWLAAQASTLYAPVSGRLGSIGVYTEHIDVSRMLEQAGVTVTLIAHGDHKVDGHPYAPLPDDVKARIQAQVDEIGGEFEAAVARGRGVSKKDVVDTFGQGQTFRGKQAIALGMADKLGTFSQVVARLTKSRPGMAASPMADGVTEAIVAAAADDEEEETPAPGCRTCAASGCGCTAVEACSADCPTCDQACGCRQESASAEADAAAITAALSAD